MNTSSDNRIFMDGRYLDFMRHSGAFGRTMMMQQMPASAEVWMKRPTLAIVNSKSIMHLQYKMPAGSFAMYDAKTQVDCGNSVEIEFLDWIPKAFGHFGEVHDFYSDQFQKTLVHAQNGCTHSASGPELLLSVNGTIARWFCHSKVTRTAAWWIARHRIGELRTQQVTTKTMHPVKYFAPVFSPAVSWTFMSEFMPSRACFPDIRHDLPLPGRIQG